MAAPSAEAARAALVDDWCAAHQSGAKALMIAHRRRDVADLNARARERMRAIGRIGADELLANGRAFAVGDRVVATRNDRALGVVNGTVAAYSFVLRGYVRHWLGAIWAEYDRIGLIDVVHPKEAARESVIRPRPVMKVAEAV